MSMSLHVEVKNNVADPLNNDSFSFQLFFALGSSMNIDGLLRFWCDYRELNQKIYSDCHLLSNT